MKGTRWTVTLLLLLVCPVAAQSQANAPATAPPSILAGYLDSEKGLKQLASDMLEAAKADDRKRLEEFSEALLLPEGSNWFRATFGEDWGKDFTEDYDRRRNGIRAGLVQAFVGIVSENLEKLEVFRFDGPCDNSPNEKIYSVLLTRLSKTPLYAVQALEKSGKKGKALWFFAHAEGSFRFVWQVKAPAPPPASGSAKVVPLEGVGRIQVGGNVQQARLLEQARPEYPQQARAGAIQGTVRLLAIIGTDGRIQRLDIQQGSHCLLAEAAMAAVRKWRYSPTLLKGEPIEVVTTIDVIFTLSNR